MLDFQQEGRRLVARRVVVELDPAAIGGVGILDLPEGIEHFLVPIPADYEEPPDTQADVEESRDPPVHAADMVDPLIRGVSAP